MKWTALCLTLTAALGASALANTTAPSAASTKALPVPTATDVDKAATLTAAALNGVLKNCPSIYATIGTPGKRCVGLSGDVETVRGKVSAALASQLYGVWRSRDDQRTVYNWLKMPSGAVYLRILPDEAAAGRSLIYLDAPTVAAQSSAAVPAGTSTTATAGPAAGAVSKTAPPKASAPKLTVPKAAATSSKPTASPPATNPPATNPGPAAAPNVASPPAVTVKPTGTFQAPSPSSAGTTATTTTASTHTATPPATKAASSGPAFSRILQLSNPRLNGPDVLAAQTRLIALTLPESPTAGPSQGDGWYGPNTANTVRDFQSANGLAVTGAIDKVTWTLLFSADAKKFQAAKK